MFLFLSLLLHCFAGVVVVVVVVVGFLLVDIPHLHTTQSYLCVVPQRVGLLDFWRAMGMSV